MTYDQNENYPQPYAQGPDLPPGIMALMARGRKVYYYDMAHSVINASAAALIQTGVTTDAITQMSGSYNKLDVVSDDASDSNAGASGNARSIKAWGLDSNNLYRVEEMDISGTTKQSSTNQYLATNAIWVSAWGVGKTKAIGNIDIGLTGKVTAETLRIAADTNESTALRLYIPKYWRAKIMSLDSNLAGSSKIAMSFGNLVTPKYCRATDKSFAKTLEKDTHMFDGASRTPIVINRNYGNDITYSKLEIWQQASDNSELAVYTTRARIALWCDNMAVSKTRRVIHGDI